MSTEQAPIPDIKNSLKKKFSQQFFLLASLVSLPALLCFFFLLLINQQNNLFNTIKNELQASKNSAQIAAYNIDRTIAKTITDGLVSTDSVAYSEITLEDGTVLARTGIKPETHGFWANFIFEEKKPYGADLMFNIANQQTLVGQIQIYPDYNYQAEHIGYELLFGLLFVSVMLTVIFVLSNKLIHRELSLPIIVLASDIANIKNRPLDKHKLNAPPNHESDEIGYLINHFNQLIDDLKLSENLASSIQDELETTEVQYTAMIKNSVEIFMRLGHDGKIDFCNPASERLLGHKQYLMTGNYLADYIIKDDRKTFINNLQQTVQDPSGNTDMTLTFLTENGEKRILFCTLSNALNVEKLNSMLFVARDVTQAQNTQRELQQMQKLESVGHLTGGIAHDFNNILTIIINNIEIAQARLKEDDPSYSNIDLALQAAFGGADLTSRLLAFARNQPLNPETFSPNERIQNLLPMLERTISRNIRINADLADDIHNIELDRSQFENAILNLCINARDAIDEKGYGHIYITTQNVSGLPFETENSHEQDYACITIRDDGIGIEEKNLKKIIDPFFTTKPLGKGSGLGLSMIYGFVNQSGGHLQIESQKNIGTSVLMYFPISNKPKHIASTQQTGENTPKSETVNGAGLSILILEDDHNVLKILKTLMAEFGFQVFASGVYDRAIKIYKEENIDIILSDVLLQDDRNGFDFANEILSIKPDACILHMSGYADVDDADNSNNYKIALKKPFRKLDLIRELNQALLEHGIHAKD